MPLTIATLATPLPSGIRVNGRRVLLMLGTVAALVVAGTLGSGATSSETDPDLARLLHFMALMKGVFAVVALAASYWRLARPATPWREAVYVAGPGMMAAGALCLWQFQAAGLAAIVLHAGMFALLAAALTDAAFVPALNRRMN